MIKFFATAPRGSTLNSFLDPLPVGKAIEELVKQNALMEYVRFSEGAVPKIFKGFSERLDRLTDSYIERAKIKDDRDSLGLSLLKAFRSKAKFFPVTNFHRYWMGSREEKEENTLVPYSKSMFSFLDLFQFSVDRVTATALLFELVGEHIDGVGPCMCVKPTQSYSLEIKRPGDILSQGSMHLVDALGSRETTLNQDALILVLSGTCLSPIMSLHGQVSPSFVAKTAMVYGPSSSAVPPIGVAEKLSRVFRSPWTIVDDARMLNVFLERIGISPLKDNEGPSGGYYTEAELLQKDESVSSEAIGDDEEPSEDDEMGGEDQDNIGKENEGDSDPESDPDDSSENEESTDTTGEDEDSEEPKNLSDVEIEFELEEKATIGSHAYKTQVNEFLSHVLQNPHLYSGEQCFVARSLANCWLFYLSETTVKNIITKIFPRR